MVQSCPENCIPCDFLTQGANGDVDGPNVVFCLGAQMNKTNGLGADGVKDKTNGTQRVKKSRSRELRASILHVGCHCCKKNGLQDFCQRSDCMGSPACLTVPEPSCGPSEYCNGRHLGLPRDYQWSADNDMQQGGGKPQIPDDSEAVYACYRVGAGIPAPQ